MLIAIQEEHVESVPGIAEITALATTGRAPSELELSGMNVKKIKQLLSHELIGLQSHQQVDEESERTAFAMHCYLRSGVPLLVPVDLGRMRGDTPGLTSQSIYAKNGLRFRQSRKLRTDTPRLRENHAVVLTGYSTKDHENFLINDPATYPFLKASIDDLFRVRPYHGEHHWVDTPFPLDLFSFISPTHRDVNVPLLRFVTGEFSNELSDCGLLHLALQALHEDSSSLFCESLTTNQLSEIVGEFVLVHPERDFSNACSYVAVLIREAFSTLLDSRSIPQGWYWVQFIRPNAKGQHKGLLRLWDAECEMPDRGAVFRDLLTATFHIDVDGTLSNPILPQHLPIKVCKREELPESEFSVVHTQSLAKTGTLQPSILSSYCLVGVSAQQDEHLSAYSPSSYKASLNADAQMACVKVPTELYLFMETEMKEWAQEFGRWYKFWCPRAVEWAWAPPVNAAEFLARISDGEADQILERLSIRFPAAERPIVALASFLPEITRHYSNRHANPAIEAIKRLLYFAAKLRASGHPTRIVELVTGSVMQGILFRDDVEERGRKYFVRQHSREVITDRLFDNLGLALHSAPEGSDEVVLAMELEPGPCFLLNNWDSLEMFIRKLKGRAALDDRVGFNMDIGHWRVAKITAQRVNDHPDVKQRIIHAHLSAHHRCAHFGDAPLIDHDKTPDGNGDVELMPWLHLLRSVYEGKGSPETTELACSYHVSLELEATKSIEFVKDSYITMMNLLREVNASERFP